jgi:hypothetical protein
MIDRAARDHDVVTRFQPFGIARGIKLLDTHPGIKLPPSPTSNSILVPCTAGACVQVAPGGAIGRRPAVCQLTLQGLVRAAYLVSSYRVLNGLSISTRRIWPKPALPASWRS